VGATPIQVIVSNWGSPVGTETLNRIAAAFQFVTWPEATQVATTTTIKDASGASDQDQYAHIYFAPANPLTDRWYAMSLTSLPQGVSWTGYRNLFQTGAGVQAARFRPDSFPVVSGVRVSDKGSTHLVDVVFSENVTGDFSQVVLKSNAGAVVPCQVISSATGAQGSTAPNSSVIPPKQGAPVGISDVQLSCSAIDITQSLALNIGTGVTRSDGATINGGSPTTMTMAAKEWVDIGGGAKAWKPSSP
jgi:hypothetical protein